MSSWHIDRTNLLVEGFGVSAYFTARTDHLNLLLVKGAVWFPESTSFDLSVPEPRMHSIASNILHGTSLPPARSYR